MEVADNYPEKKYLSKTLHLRTLSPIWGFRGTTCHGNVDFIQSIITYNVENSKILSSFCILSTVYLIIGNLLLTETVVWWPSAAIVNFQFENDIPFEKRHLNLFQNFKTPFISKKFTNATIKWTKTAKQFLFRFRNFHFCF